MKSEIFFSWARNAGEDARMDTLKNIVVHNDEYALHKSLVCFSLGWVLDIKKHWHRHQVTQSKCPNCPLTFLIFFGEVLMSPIV